MDDIVEVLRINCGHLTRHRPCFHDDAADEIDRLRARLDAADRLAEAGQQMRKILLAPSYKIQSGEHTLELKVQWGNEWDAALTEYEEARDGD